MSLFSEIIIQADEDQQEMLVALLSAEGYDSFWQEENQLKAYVPSHLLDKGILYEICTQVGVAILSAGELAVQNWNETWEKNYPPVTVGDFCLIRSEFHAEDGNFKHVITIQPKMSFGTGHHATTQLMVQMMQNLDFGDKHVLDMGCGTGVLGILAHKMGAKSVAFRDIEDWAIINTEENIARNQADKNSNVQLGGAETLQPNTLYDIILANINRNVLVADSKIYTQVLKNGGFLVLSGFFDFDAPNVHECYKALGLTEIRTLEQENWHAILFQKP